MAAAKILGGGNLHHRCHCVTLPTKPYSTPSKLLFSQPTKIRPFSVRADNDRLPPYDVRKRPICGIDFSGRRVTVGDVASKDSFKLNQAAQRALQALDVDTNGRLRVWDDGVFHKNLALKLFSIKFESMLEKGKMAMAFLMRVSFWVSLVASSSVPLTVALCITILIGIIDVKAATKVLEETREAFLILFDAKLNECDFSYAFGDGDPNQGIEEKRWRMIGLYIALNGSVVTAEEIAPYLDQETTGKMDDDSYMLPVLQKFDGQPKVDEEGNILYHFPSVHCTPLPRTSSREKEYAGRWVDRDIKVDKFLEEHQWKFSEYDDSPVDFVVSRLSYILFCAILSGFFLRVIGRGSYFLYLFLPLHLMYAIYTVSFIVISSIRKSSIKKRNAEIVKKNEAREEHAKSLESPDLSLMRKLLSARTMAQRASIRNDRIVYGSDNDLYEQLDYERREWDQRFNEGLRCISKVLE